MQLATDFMQLAVAVYGATYCIFIVFLKEKLY